MPRPKEVLAAADRLEELTVIMKHMVNRFRTGEETNPYKAAYWLRKELGYVVKDLGWDAAEANPNTTVVGQYYESLVTADEKDASPEQ